MEGRTVLVVAPHGGKIEPTTTEIAEAIAGDDYSFYSFEGLKANGNGVFHIESHIFDEPRALNMVKEFDIVVTVHGQIDQNHRFVMVGGLDKGLRLEVMHQLEVSGIETRLPVERLSGTDPNNICNRGRSKGGVQLEISRQLRDALRRDGDSLQSFADTIRRAIRLHLPVK